MAMIELHPDFKEFLRLLNSKDVKYLLVGGYAVCFHGYSRSTADMDILIAIDAQNSQKVCQVLREFGFSESQVKPELFLQRDQVIRMGVAPVKIEIITSASGIDFEDCYRRRVMVQVNDLTISVIGLEDLKINKSASGRHKDLEDIMHLP